MTLAELVFSYMEYRDRQKEGEVWAKCPLCNDTQFRMGLNYNTGQAQCFRGTCGFKTSSKSLLFNKLCTAFGLTGEQLSDRDEKPKKKQVEKSPVKVVLPKEFEPLWKNVNDSIGKKALKYVKARGITDKQIHHHRIGFCAVGKYSYRIIFPVFRRGRLVGLVGRDFSGISKTNTDVPRYLNSEGTKTLYNVPRKKQSKALLSEGPIDSLATERAIKHIDHIGRLGSTLTKEQKKILLKYKEVTIWPDPDEVGVKGAIEVAKYLTKKRRKVTFILPTANDTDPGSLGETTAGLHEIKRRYKNRAVWDNETSPSLLRIKVLFD